MKITVLHIVILVLASISESALDGGYISNVFKKDSNDGFVLSFNCNPSEIETIGKSLSLSCLELLTTQRHNLTSFSDYIHGLCETCGEPLYQLIRDCVGDTTGRFLQTLDVLCATNEQGNKCYNVLVSQENDKDLFSECERSPCSSACKRDLETSNDEHGCCLYSSLVLLRDAEGAEKLWSRCDVNPPDLCERAFTTSPVVPIRGSGSGVEPCAFTSYMSTSIIIFLSVINV